VLSSLPVQLEHCATSWSGKTPESAGRKEEIVALGVAGRAGSQSRSPRSGHLHNEDEPANLLGSHPPEHFPSGCSYDEFDLRRGLLADYLGPSPSTITAETPKSPDKSFRLGNISASVFVNIAESGRDFRSVVFQGS
jgi:hypothetical protein